MATDGAPPRALRAFVPLAALALLAVAPAGCGDPDRPPGLGRRAVTLDKVPEPVMKAAKTSLPGVDLAEAWKNVDREGKLHSYEIRGRSSNGKVREARVSPEGKVLEME